jgi:NAD(P)-dependent dehydrogenase (short-subunit alcohol dehydrogenase family)
LSFHPLVTNLSFVLFSPPQHLAYEYALRGANLVLAARRENLLKKNAERCRQLGSPDVLVVRADLSVEENNKKVVDAAVNHFGGGEKRVCLRPWIVSLPFRRCGRKKV